jgi:hypothetical protein
VPENAEKGRDQTPSSAVPLAVLHLQESDKCLRHRQTQRFRSMSILAILGTLVGTPILAWHD